MNNQWQLIDYLIEKKVLNTPEVILAFKAIDRADFIPAEVLTQAYLNEPLPIGFGQTISQPQTVAFILEQLKPAPGQKILDIGTGSGWQAALLAQVISHDHLNRLLPESERGQVISLEIQPELAKRARKNIAPYDFIRRKIIEVHCLNARWGYSSGAPFDRIISAARVEEIPPAWIEQLVCGGRLITPKGNHLIIGEKNKAGNLEIKTEANFSFVPFVK